MQLLDNVRLKAAYWPECNSLRHGWQLLGSMPGQFGTPSDLPLDAGWLAVPELGPVADVLRQLGKWSLNSESRRFDGEDWWYRLYFDVDASASSAEKVLHFDGLATVADVWLNGQLILSSANMFVAHQCNVSQLLKTGQNELVLVFRSLDQALTKRRPRPRWRVPMIDNQQLRWFRTTVLGRTPGWTPPVAVVGPWRGVWLSSGVDVSLASLQVRPLVQADEGRLVMRCNFDGAHAAGIDHVVVNLERDGRCQRFDLNHLSEGEWQVDGAVSDVALWWPHTHGEPALYELSLEVSFNARTRQTVLQLGKVGFRSIEVDQSKGGFGLKVNGVLVFCRGACWTPLDPVTLDARSPQAYQDAIKQVCVAGMNMLRVGGTMTYEADQFYDECDRQGVLVWQDLMFANMDYPEDSSFVELAKQEVSQQCMRWQGRPSIAILCGNSEVEQQAAMFGATRDRWSPALFHQVLADVCHDAHPDLPYWPSSAHGGAFPHQSNVGTTSYYGVGAYQRPLEDARRAEVRFATECLAFSNTPEVDCLSAMPGGLSLRSHHSIWKSRAPRDLGAGWDFEDVRDHYLSELFEVDTSRLRYSDHDRYLALGRVAVGEVMASTYAEWRRQDSTCQGALIWFLRDLWPGAGWGVVDSIGQPKATYYYLRRSLQPITVSMTDEGGSGYFLHATNETTRPIRASLEVKALRHGQIVVAQSQKEIVLPARGQLSEPLVSLFDWFSDWSWSYRFGPVTAQVLQVVMRDETGSVLASTHAFPGGFALPVEHDLGLKATAKLVSPGVFDVTLHTTRFAQAVYWDIDKAIPTDAYFHLMPGECRTVRIQLQGSSSDASALSGSVRAVNLDGAISVRMEGGTSS